jgi:PAS domain S-box-containing protein
MVSIIVKGWEMTSGLIDSLVQKSKDAAFVVFDGKISNWNTPFIDLFDFEQEEAKNIEIHNLFSEKDLNDINQFINCSEKHLNLEATFSKLVYAPFTANVEIVKENNLMLCYIIPSINPVDISCNNNNFDDEIFKDLFQLVDIGVKVISLDKKVLLINKAYREMFNINPQDTIRGNNCYQFKCSEKCDINFCVLDKVKESLKHIESDVSLIVNNEERNFILTTFPYFKDNELYCFVQTYKDITERKRSEKKLIQKDAEMQSLLMSVDDIVFEMDEEGYYHNVWTNNEEMLILAKDTLIGKYLRDIFPDKYINPFYNAFQFVATTKNPYTLDYSLDEDDGRRFYTAKITPYEKKTEKMHLVLLVRDVTDQKRVENLLVESENKFRTIFEKNVNAMCIIDSDKNFVMVNDQFTSLTRFTQEELYGKNVCEVLGQVKKEECNDAFKKMIMNGSATSYENRAWIIDKSGNIIYVLVGASYIGDENESNIIMSFVDITENIKRNLEIKKLSKAVEQNPSIIVITDTNGLITYVNPRFEEVTGYTKDEVLGENPSILKSGHTPKVVYDNLWNTIRDGKNWNGEYSNKKKNGEEYWVSSAISPIRDDNGNIVNYVAVKEDITQKRLAENALKASREKLKELNATKDRLFSIIAHDLKTPFNALLSISELLKLNHDNFNKDQLERYFDMINANAKQSFELLENLLIWSRSQTDNIKFSPKSENILQLINSVKQLLDPVAETKKISFDIHETSNPIYAFCDYRMIETVLRNLISNAIKFTPNSGNVSVYYEDHNNGFITVKVQDSGVGIEYSNLDKLFRIDNNFSTKGTNNEKGTGLGLILCKEFVEKNGGEISVSSEVGKGTTFTFTLPKVAK